MRNGSRLLIRRTAAYDGNPVTISPPSGATFEGLSSISLYGQYSYVELERISATVFALGQSATPSEGKAMVWGTSGWDYKDFTVTLPAAGASTTVAHGITNIRPRRIDGAFEYLGETYLFDFIDELGGRSIQVVARCSATNLIVYCSDTILSTIPGTTAFVRVWYLP